MAESFNDFLAGWIGGAAGILIGNPLDVAKARLQAPKQSTSSTSCVGAWETLHRMVQAEGVGSLFKGVMAPVMGLAGLNAILFVSYGSLLRALHPGDDAPSLMQVYLAGCGGGIASFFLSTPTELIKIKAQVSRSNKSVWDVSRQIYRQHGLGGFYQGGWITLIRDTPSYGIYFWVYEGMKRALQVQDYEDSGTQQAWKLLLAGGLAGTISWSSIYPIDVIKSRLQMQSIPSSSVSLLPISPIVHSSPTSSFSSATLQHTSAAVDDPLLQHQQKISHAHSATHFTSIRDCVVRSYRSEGISVFFRGLGPTVLRAFPVNAVTFWVYELVIGWLSGK